MCHPKNLCQSRIILNHYKPILSPFESVLVHFQDKPRIFFRIDFLDH